MSFAPEDKRAWQDSQVMAELEKIAKDTGLLNGPPKEAYEPISLKAASDTSEWEDEEERQQAPSALGVGEINGLEAAKAVTDGLEALASNLVSADRFREAHLVERTLDDVRKAVGTDILIARALLTLANDLEDEGSAELANAVDAQMRTYVERTELTNPQQNKTENKEQEEGDAPHNPE